MLSLKKNNFFEENNLNPEDFPLCKIQELLKKAKISYVNFSLDLIQDLMLKYKKTPIIHDLEGKLSSNI